MNSICKFKTCRITKFTSYELQFSTMYKKYRQLDKMMKIQDSYGYYFYY